MTEGEGSVSPASHNTLVCLQGCDGWGLGRLPAYPKPMLAVVAGAGLVPLPRRGVACLVAAREAEGDGEISRQARGTEVVPLEVRTVILLAEGVRADGELDVRRVGGVHYLRAARRVREGRNHLGGG